LKGLLLLIVAAVLWGGVVPCGAAREDNLALFNLRPINFEAMGYDGEILYALISALESDKTIVLMPRREMEEILYQKGIVQSDDPDAIAEAGRALGIRFVLFGNVAAKSARILAELNLMDVQNSRVVRSWNYSFTGRDDILSVIPEFAEELSRTIKDSCRHVVAAPRRDPGLPDIRIENFKTRSEGKKVVLRWRFDPSDPIIGFHVYRSDSMGGPFQFLGRTNRNRFEDHRIKMGSTYYYRLGILLVDGREIKSELCEIRNAGEKLPYPPLVLSAKGYIRRAEIKFVPSLLNDQDDFDIRSYRIYRKRTQGGAWRNINEISSKMSSQTELGYRVEDTAGLEDGLVYMYAISSVDEHERESPLSESIAVTTVRCPTLRAASQNLLRRAVLEWDAVETVGGYYLYRRVSPEEWTRIAKIRGRDEVRFEDRRDLEDGQTYQYRITAYDAGGETGPSNTVDVHVKDLPRPPGDLSAKSGLVKSVELSWTPREDPDIGGYAIYRGLDPAQMQQIAKIKGYTKNSYLDKGRAYSPLADGTDYYYAVSSYNLFGAEGELSMAVQAATKPRPSRVSGISLRTVSRGEGQGAVVVEWDASPERDMAYYILYRSKGGGRWSKVAEVDAGSNFFEDADLKAGAYYRYRIVAVDADDLESDPAESEEVKSPLVEK